MKWKVKSKKDQKVKIPQKNVMRKKTQSNSAEGKVPKKKTKKWKNKIQRAQKEEKIPLKRTKRRHKSIIFSKFSKSSFNYESTQIDQRGLQGWVNKFINLH